MQISKKTTAVPKIVFLVVTFFTTHYSVKNIPWNSTDPGNILPFQNYRFLYRVSAIVYTLLIIPLSYFFYLSLILGYATRLYEVTRV